MVGTLLRSQEHVSIQMHKTFPALFRIIYHVRYPFSKKSIKAMIGSPEGPSSFWSAMLSRPSSDVGEIEGSGDADGLDDLVGQVEAVVVGQLARMSREMDEAERGELRKITAIDGACLAVVALVAVAMFKQFLNADDGVIKKQGVANLHNLISLFFEVAKRIWWLLRVLVVPAWFPAWFMVTSVSRMFHGEREEDDGDQGNNNDNANDVTNGPNSEEEERGGNSYNSKMSPVRMFFESLRPSHSW